MRFGAKKTAVASTLDIPISAPSANGSLVLDVKSLVFFDPGFYDIHVGCNPSLCHVHRIFFVMAGPMGTATSPSFTV